MCKEDKHDWKDLGHLITYPRDEPVMPTGQPYGGYMLVRKDISVLWCSKCGQLRLVYDPWEKILGEKKDES